MRFFLGLHVTYEHIEIGIFSGGDLKAFTQKDKQTISRYLTHNIDDLLAKMKLILEDCSFIAVGQGPAPFTSLRVLLSFINGISFAANIPLVGVDGLTQFLLEHAQNNQFTIALFNAFSNDAYFGIMSPKKTVEIGYESIHDLLPRIATLTNHQPIRWIGHGVVYFFDIINQYGFALSKQETIPLYLSLHQLGIAGYQSFIAGNKSSPVLPLYTKQTIYKPSFT